MIDSKFDFSASPINRAALIETIAKIREMEGYSYRTIAKNVGEFGEKSGIIYENLNPDFAVDDNFIMRLLSNDGEFSQGKNEGRSIKVNESKFIGILIWTVNRFGPLFHHYVEQERFMNFEPMVCSIREMFGHGSDINMDRVRSFRGSYRLYRPSHIFPDRIVNVARLEIGGSGTDFECKFLHRFEDDFGKLRNNHFSGKIIPASDRMVAILKGTGLAKIFLFADEIDEDSVEENSDRMVISLGGTMLVASTSNHPSSAWPFFAYRNEDSSEFSPFTIERSSREFDNLPRPIKNRLSRGAVNWKDS